MIKGHSIQNRLFLAFAGLSLVVCLFFIRLSTLFISTAETNTYKAVLLQEQDHLIKLLNRGEKPVSRVDYIVAYPQLDTLPVGFKRRIGEQFAGEFTGDDQQRYLFSRFIHNNHRYLLLMNLNRFSANEDLFRYKSLFLYSISLSAILLCLTSSWYLAKWLSLPILALTRDVERYRPQELDRTTNIPEMPPAFYGLARRDEIGELAKALERSYSQAQSLLLRERNFTRDVSHELRTPITLIKNTLALHADRPLDKSAFETLNDASQELENTVEVLLALARQENLHFTEQRLLPLVEKAVLIIYHMHPQQVFDVRIEVCSSLTATGNPLLITLLLQNLVNNGFYHGGRRAMLIRSDKRQLIFENPVCEEGLSAEYQGLGHGQYLVKRIVEQMGWRIRVEPSPDLYRVVIDTQQQFAHNVINPAD